MKKLNTILYAEDEEDIRSIAKIALEDIGSFQVKYCANGKEAIEIANSFIPDLVLLDVMMPIMDGPSTLYELRKLPNFKSIPTLFMTAKIQPDEVKEYKNMGALDVIPKPFDPLTLADEIQKIWDKWNG